MLRWRLIIGTVLVVLLLVLCWLDARGNQPGVYLFFLGLVICLLAVEELLAMYRAVGHSPHGGAVRAGALVTFCAACLPAIQPDSWNYPPLVGVASGMAIGFIINVLYEMFRYVSPGSTINQLSLGAFAIIYLGGLLGFFVQLRLLPVAGDVARGGMLALFSMIAVVKFTDIGAYFAGKKWGKNKMAPLISPGKTWEGAIGGLTTGTLMALFILGPFVQLIGLDNERTWGSWLGGAIVYGILVSGAGMLGDLAESLLKRDAGMKDSSTWLPGFGGVLDLLDSLLVAAPVAYFLWAATIVGV